MDPSSLRRHVDRGFVLAVLTVPTLGVALALWLASRGAPIGEANLVIALVLWAGTLFGIEGGYHRYFSHHAFRTGPVFEVTLAVLGSLAFQGPVLWWAATHRRHHAHADKPGDPHSPHLAGKGPRAMLRGLFYAHAGWLLTEVDDISRGHTWKGLVPDLRANRRIKWVHRYYMVFLVLGLALPAVLGGLATGTLHGAWMGFLWGGLVRVFAVNHAIWAVNSVCHVFGARPFAHRARDLATNNVWLALPTLGASFHHNHHVFPAAATTQLRWWQIDLTGWVLRLLAVIGVVSGVRSPPRHHTVPGRVESASVSRARGATDHA